jgi:hypothetical protein
MKRTIKTEEKNIAKKAKFFLRDDKKEDFGSQHIQANEVNCSLDDLAKLFQSSTYSRVATCLIDTTIVIADDKIQAGSLSGETVVPKIELIRTVMEYFSDLANERPEHKKSREEVFKQLYIAKLCNLGTNYMWLDDNIIDNISKEILDCSRIGRQQAYTHLEQKIYSYDSRLQYVVLDLYKIGIPVVRDFIMIERFIEINRTDGKNDLVTAFKGKESQAIFIDHTGGILKGCQGSVQYGEQSPGYIMLDIDVVGVHPKAKIIEYLVYTGIVKDIVTGDKIYIGTSGACCKMCNDLAKAVNKVFCSKEEVIQIVKTHGLHFDWVGPMICKEDPYERHTTMYFHYAVNSEQIKELNELVPELRDTTGVSAKDSMNIQAPNAQCEKIEKLMLKLKNESWSFENKKSEDNVFTSKETTCMDTTWYDYLAIKDSLMKKGTQVGNILKAAQSEEELEDILNQINMPNHAYIIPLNVNAIDGSFSATNHWVGLYVTTDETTNITSIKYINPIGQRINQQLALKLLVQTNVGAKDLTEGKGVQFAYSKEFVPELKGNNNDCGPMLVQLFYELSTYGEILTCSLNKQESLEFGQECRKEQRWDKDNELKEEETLIDSAVSDQNAEIGQDAIVFPTVELGLAGVSCTLNM